MNELANPGWIQLKTLQLVADDPAVPIVISDQYANYCFAAFTTTGAKIVVDEDGTESLIEVGSDPDIHGSYARGVKLYGFSAVPSPLTVTLFGSNEGELGELPLTFAAAGGGGSVTPHKLVGLDHEAGTNDTLAGSVGGLVVELPFSQGFPYTPGDFENRDPNGYMTNAITGFSVVTSDPPTQVELANVPPGAVSVCRGLTYKYLVTNDGTRKEWVKLEEVFEYWNISGPTANPEVANAITVDFRVKFDGSDWDYLVEIFDMNMQQPSVAAFYVNASAPSVAITNANQNKQLITTAGGIGQITVTDVVGASGAIIQVLMSCTNKIYEPWRVGLQFDGV